MKKLETDNFLNVAIGQCLHSGLVRRIERIINFHPRRYSITNIGDVGVYVIIEHFTRHLIRYWFALPSAVGALLIKIRH